MTLTAARTSSGGIDPPSPTPRSLSRVIASLHPGVWFLLACILLAGLAISLPINHDEGQYVAPVALAARYRPFADFIYLQTPLQIYVTAPLGPLMAGWSFLGLRLVNAAMGAATLALIYRVMRRLQAPRERALAASGLLLACYIFQFSTVTARNDALPALLEAAALLAMVMATSGARAPSALWSLAGLCLGAATSAKISYALPLAGAGLYLLTGTIRRRIPLAALVGYSAAGLVGLLPNALAWAAAPEAFMWGVFTYATKAPVHWYREVGQGVRLGLPWRVMDGGFHLMVGPALAVLATVAAASLAGWRAKASATPSLRLLQVLVLVGLVAAFAPSPMQRQYFMPILPPLFALWAVRDGLGGEIAPLPRNALAGLTAIGLLIGVGNATFVLGSAAVGLTQGRLPPALQLTAEAHWIGRTLDAAGAEGPIATPSPQVVADSGKPIDPRFASGAFAYRSADMVPDAEQRRLHIVSPRTLARALDAAPPAAIVTGYEPPTGKMRRNVDDDFRAYAMSRGYQPLRSPYDRAELWIRPR
jgi:4-amino-4-deoxy-L-arabinose transferase-like glycosyltransferase